MKLNLEDGHLRPLCLLSGSKDMNKDIDITGKVFKTERLILREWTLNDLDDFYEYCKVEGVGENAGWAPHKNKEESLKILNSFIEGKHIFCLEYNGKAIGSLGIEKYDEECFPELSELKGREIGFVLSKDYWGKGLMPEAVKTVIDYLFEQEKLDFILCGHFIWNQRSETAQKKMGFRFYSQYQGKDFYGNETLHIYNIITKEDYYGKEGRENQCNETA